MKAARKKFLLSAMLAILILLTTILAVINGINYTMAASDADEITRMIADNGGGFGPQPEETPFRDERHFGKPLGPWGPNSPETRATIRYFTFAFDEDGNAKAVNFEMLAVSEEEAAAWASGLLSEETGWTHATYRYRVYEAKGLTYVTVIDMGRELLPAYRILLASLIGEALGLAIAFLFLLYVSRRLFRPLEEADRKQKRFLEEAEKEFKVPLTVIRANTELIEREGGVSEHTQSINRQVRKMADLVSKLSGFAIFAQEAAGEKTNLSALLEELCGQERGIFADAGLILSADIAPGITVAGGPGRWNRILDELFINARKFGKGDVAVRLAKEKERVRLALENGTELPDAETENVFDRFVRLENAKDIDGAGLGLSYVKEWAASLGARPGARVEGGRFILQLKL